MSYESVIHPDQDPSPELAAVYSECWAAADRELALIHREIPHGAPIEQLPLNTVAELAVLAAKDKDTTRVVRCANIFTTFDEKWETNPNIATVFCAGAYAGQPTHTVMLRHVLAKERAAAQQAAHMDHPVRTPLLERTLTTCEALGESPEQWADAYAIGPLHRLVLLIEHWQRQYQADPRGSVGQDAYIALHQRAQALVHAPQDYLVHRLTSALLPALEDQPLKTVLVHRFRDVATNAVSRPDHSHLQRMPVAITRRSLNELLKTSQAIITDPELHDTDVIDDLNTQIQTSMQQLRKVYRLDGVMQAHYETWELLFRQYKTNDPAALIATIDSKTQRRLSVIEEIGGDDEEGTTSHNIMLQRDENLQSVALIFATKGNFGAANRCLQHIADPDILRQAFWGCIAQAETEDEIRAIQFDPNWLLTQPELHTYRQLGSALIRSDSSGVKGLSEAFVGHLSPEREAPGDVEVSFIAHACDLLAADNPDSFLPFVRATLENMRLAGIPYHHRCVKLLSEFAMYSNPAAEALDAYESIRQSPSSAPNTWNTLRNITALIQTVRNTQQRLRVQT